MSVRVSTSQISESSLFGITESYSRYSDALRKVNTGKQLQKPRISMRSPVWKAFWTGFGALTVSQFVMSLTTMIDQFSAVSLGAGANATLGYATRLLALALGLLSTAIARAVTAV